MTGTNPTVDVPVAASRMRSRLWRLIAWLGFVGIALAASRRLTGWQDYKNSGIHIAIIAATLGAGLWTLRNSGGTLRRRSISAALVCLPLWSVSPLGPVELVNNGNVGVAGWRWRWGPKPDELLEGPRAANRSIAWETTPQDYPAFLGGKFWAEVDNVEIDPDWKARQPKPLWRQPIGAGWSGFAVVGDYAVSQEQRGANELVVCYEVETGRVVWSHEDAVRWDPGGSGALGGVGPRATPTVFEGRVYSVGATGILNCLDGATGRLLWTHDTLVEEDAENLMWGKACSPIVVDDCIVVSVGGINRNSLVAYDLATGKKVWSGGDRHSSYATPVLTELDGVRQIVVVNENAITAHDPASGAVLWEHPWDGNSGSNASNSQPVPIDGDRLLLTKGYSVPAEVIELRLIEDHTWEVTTIWQKHVLRTKMSNVLIRDGYAYAIDDIDLVCVDLESGRRKWKSRRRPEFGNGQIMFVGETILALSESGEVILVAASSKQYRELASFQAIDGVTWNNPALSGSRLLVRNAEEAACFELPLLSSGEPDGGEPRAAEGRDGQAAGSTSGRVVE